LSMCSGTVLVLKLILIRLSILVNFALIVYMSNYWYTVQECWYVCTWYYLWEGLQMFLSCKSKVN